MTEGEANDVLSEFIIVLARGDYLTKEVEEQPEKLKMDVSLSLQEDLSYPTTL